MLFCLQACEFTEQAESGGRAGFRAHHQPAVGVFALPEPARVRRCRYDLVASLAEQFHLNAAQIRKDLAYFGEFGVRGVGYYVKDLKRHLRQILGLDRKLRVAVMGAGNLGLALADYPGFKREGFEIVSMFDVADTKIGDESKSGVPIHDLRELKKIVRKEHIDIAVIAVPAESAQHVLDQVVAAGIKAILNFSPGALKVPAGVKMKGVDLTVSLESLSFYLAQGEDDES